MNIQKEKPAPFLSRIKDDLGSRQNPYLLYITKGGKSDSRIFHFKENNKYFQYRKESVNRNSVTLQCICIPSNSIQK